MSNSPQLRVWHNPQIPGPFFYVPISDLQTGVTLLNILAAYDKFQFDNRIKPDYASVNGIEMFQDGEWQDWYDDETGIDDPHEYLATVGVSNE